MSLLDSRRREGAQARDANHDDAHAPKGRAVQRDGVLAQAVEVNDGAQRAANQALNLHGTTLAVGARLVRRFGLAWHIQPYPTRARTASPSRSPNFDGQRCTQDACRQT